MPGPRLIVGIGNPEFSDSGIGWRLGSHIADEMAIDKLVVNTIFELTSEAVPPVAGCSSVLFIVVDPGAPPGEVHFGRLHRDSGLPRDQVPSHLSPAGVLELAYRLHSAEPEAWLLTVGGEDFERGENLSAPVKKVWPALLDRVRSWSKAL